MDWTDKLAGFEEKASTISDPSVVALPSVPRHGAALSPLTYTADGLQRATKLHMKAFIQAQAGRLEGF